jgi:hypothetical protein
LNEAKRLREERVTWFPETSTNEADVDVDHIMKAETDGEFADLKIARLSYANTLTDRTSNLEDREKDAEEGSDFVMVEHVLRPR